MKRDLFTLPMLPGELIIDNFAGGGGTSTGLEAAFGRPVDIAISMTTTTHPGLKARVSHHVAPFVVVSNPGTMFARIEDHCGTLKAALECKGCYDDPCDVMRQLPSGELTTEF